MRARVAFTALVPMLAVLAIVFLLRRAGVIAWVPGAVIVGATTLVMAIAQIATVSRIAAAALEAVATDSGMLPLMAADARAWRAGQDEVPGRIAPRAFPERAPASLSPALSVLSPPLTTSPRPDVPGAAVSRSLAGEL
jgi:hypothetical protein